MKRNYTRSFPRTFMSFPRKRESILIAFLFFFILFLSSFSAQESAEKNDPTINILLVKAPEVVLSSPQGFYISGKLLQAGSFTFSAENGAIRDFDTVFGRSVVIVPSSAGDFLSVNGEPYRGSMLLKASGSGLTVVNQVDLENYLYGVVGREMPGSDLEALKAQAVAARTLAINVASKGGVLRSTTSQQMYRGMSGERLTSNQAVDDTRGQVLSYNGSLVTSPLFFSTCGGKTAANQDVFGKDVPYLQSVVDAEEPNDSPYCQISPHYHWQVTWSEKDLERDLSPYGITGQILDLTPTKMDANGRISILSVKTSNGEWPLRGFEIRLALKHADGQPLYSTWFTITKMENGSNVYFQADGNGSGHGVGMCQWGAIGMARAGKNYQEILAHYYTGTQLSVFHY